MQINGKFCFQEITNLSVGSQPASQPVVLAGLDIVEYACVCLLEVFLK